MKTVYQLIEEERERKNPTFLKVMVKHMYRDGTEWFFKPSNIKQHGGILEMDAFDDPKYTIPIHFKGFARIIEWIEKR